MLNLSAVFSSYFQLYPPIVEGGKVRQVRCNTIFLLGETLVGNDIIFFYGLGPE